MRRLLFLVLAVLAVLLFSLAGLCAQTAAFRRPQHPRKRAHALAIRNGAAAPGVAAAAEDADPAQVAIGERLFLETRFAQYFAAHFDGDVNHPLAHGDPVVDQVQTAQGPFPGPFAGQSINCRSCHFVDEFAGTSISTRSYADYADRSPIPAREDGRMVTARNARNMVDSSIPRGLGLFLHGDGEFSSGATLVKSTLTGRNFGWLPGEYSQAVAHVARVIRQDDGTGALAQQYAGAYSKVLLGTAPDIPAEFRLPPEYRIDVSTASDDEVVNAVARLINAYLESLEFSRDEDGVHDGSPYDLFLAKNDLPAAPVAGETDAEYSQRLLRAVRLLQNPQFVTPADGSFQYHNQPFVFGPLELEGLKIFLRQSTTSATLLPRRGSKVLLASCLACLGFLATGWGGWRRRRRGLVWLAMGGVLCSIVLACGSSGTGGSSSAPVLAAASAPQTGNCATCHAPPNFTDFSFHNTGITQDEYDAVHGDGSFAQLTIPGYQQRQQDPDSYLPATPQHPNRPEVFRAVASAADSRLTDLGMWNVYANSDFPEPQPQLQNVMCWQRPSCDPAVVLPLTIGRFRTPTVRDLGQSQPFFHSGRISSIEGVVGFYRRISDLARAGKLRNGDPALSGISIDDNDAAALAAFLRALNEDYD
jgi:hypothetical protein